MDNQRYCRKCESLVSCSRDRDGTLSCDECNGTQSIQNDAPLLLELNAETDPIGFLKGLRDMGANDDVLSIIGQMKPEHAAELVYFIADFGQNLVNEDRKKRTQPKVPRKPGPPGPPKGEFDC